MLSMFGCITAFPSTWVHHFETLQILSKRTFRPNFREGHRPLTNLLFRPLITVLRLSVYIHLSLAGRPDLLAAGPGASNSLVRWSTRWSLGVDSDPMPDSLVMFVIGQKQGLTVVASSQITNNHLVSFLGMLDPQELKTEELLLLLGFWMCVSSVWDLLPFATSCLLIRLLGT